MTSGGSSDQKDAQQQVIDRAASDPEYRRQLLQDPKGAIQEQLGVPLPAGINIRAIEEQPGEVILVVPSQTVGSGRALSDQDLENAAGGATGDTGFMAWYNH